MCKQLCPENLLEKNDIDSLIQRCLGKVFCEHADISYRYFKKQIQNKFHNQAQMI